VAGLSPTVQDKEGRLLPPVAQMRTVSAAVALAVARQAQADGVADPCAEADLAESIRAYVWEPHYRPYRKIG
jgi:malate dehydrogenase (oxaloacetate-decarboxylating)